MGAISLRLHLWLGVTLCSLVLVIPRITLAQTANFSIEPVWSSGPANETRCVSLGDVDGDGDLDLVCGNRGPSGLFQSNTLYLNEGDVFSTKPAWSSGPANETFSVSLGDVDDDGDLDLICGNLGQNNMLYLNEGGVFSTTPAWSSGPANWTLGMSLGDVDGDGDLDLVCGNSGSNTLYLNEGGVFSTTPAWSSEPNNFTTSVSLGDVDGDGDLDLLCGNSGQSNTLYLNEGDVFSTTPAWSSEQANATLSVSLGDVDGDGQLDLICGNYDQNNTLYSNEGGMFSAAPVWSSGPANETCSVALGDVDGDGDLDLVCGNGGVLGQSNTLYLNESGVFETAPVWSSGPANETRSVLLGDVDGDGALELVCGNGNQSNVLYSNDGVGFSATPGWSSDPVNRTTSVSLGDVDGDGDLDLVCGNVGPELILPHNVLYVNEGGMFLTTPAWSSGPSYSTWSVSLGDVNGDGQLDLVCGNGNQHNTLYLNEGGVFSETPVWSSGPANDTYSVSLGDVDADGDLDLVCGNYGQNNTLYLNESGVFETTPVWSSGPANETQSVSLGDVNGDGQLDLVCGNGNQRNTVYLNEGGVFSKAPVWSSIPGTVTRSVSLGDVDGDGDLDLVCGNFMYNTLYSNDGGVFSAAPVWSSGPRNATREVSFGDVDGDGDLDLVCGNSETEHDNTIYLNEDGVFSTTPVWSWGRGDQTSGMSLGDVDGDGDLDLVCGNTGRNNTLYKGEKNPVYRGNPLDPANHLPNNGAHLRRVSIQQRDMNVRRVDFSAVDVESDPVWIVLKYQFEGAPVWYPAVVDGQKGNVGPISTSPEGVVDSFEWDVSSIPFDNRDVILRLTTVEMPQRVSLIQYSASYLKKIGPIPSIASRARPSSGNDFLEGRDIIVELSLPAGATHDRARLYYRWGGEISYQETGFEAGSPSPFATISFDWIGARGIEYWVELDTGTRVFTDPRTEPSEHPRTIRITALNLQEPDKHAGERYRMMSVSLELEGSLSIIRAIEDNIGFPDPLKWRMFAHDAHNSTYIEIPNDSLSSFKVGRGYWLITRDDHRLDTGPVFGTSTPTDSAFALVLEPGWNLIGHPFAFAVAWDSMTVNGLSVIEAAGTLVEPAVAWRGDRYKHNISSFVPWEGYWVKNLTDSTVVLRIPPREAVGAVPLAKSSASGGDWAIGISASSMDAVDDYNYVGLKRDAATARDKNDRSEVPMSPGKSISLYFPHPTWKKHPGNYTVDMRGEHEKMDGGALPSYSDIDLWGHVWHFDVAKNFSDGTAGDEVVLEFSGMENVPPEAKIILVDQELDRQIDLRQTTRYTVFQKVREVVTREEDAHFVLLVGSEEFLDSQEDKLPRLPSETVLHQNHPNPFNPSTIIRYELAHAGRVTLQIYDVSGALVKVLEDRDRLAGRYEVGWNGDNEWGEKVATGVYFYKLATKNFSQTKKMILLK